MSTSKEKDTSLPSYEDSISSTPTTTNGLPFHVQPSSSQQPRLLDRLTLARSQHIRTITSTSILPVVESQASFGIAQTTLALIPSDVPLPSPEPEKNEFSFDNATSNMAKVEVIGFTGEDVPIIVRLEGQMNRTEFWRPQATINELEMVLQDSLNSSPVLKASSPVRSSFAVAARVSGTGAGTATGARGSSRRNVFGRMVDAMSREERSPGRNPEVGTRVVERAGQVLVKVRLEEICLRTVNDFGLYDTMSKQCVIIRVDARC